jgi:hypothetical protein
MTKDRFAEYEADLKRAQLRRQEDILLAFPAKAPAGVRPELYKLDRQRFVRARDKLREELGMPPAEPNVSSKGRKRMAGAGR